MGGHDASACILVNGRLIAAAEEERFNRQKHTTAFPAKSIAFCLKEANLTLNDVDQIAVPWLLDKMFGQRFSIMLRQQNKFSKRFAYHVANFVPHVIKLSFGTLEKVKQSLNADEKSRIPPIRTIEHHLAHAATAFYCSGFDSASVMTVDGYGDINSSVSWNAQGNAIQKMRQEPVTNSLGNTYQCMTEYLGFDPIGGAGKTMGLAAYGKEVPEIKDKMKKLINTDGNVWYHAPYVPDELMIPRIMGHPPRKPESELTERYKDIAYGIQKSLEDALLKVAKYTVEKSGNKTLCIAGGVGLNCKANGVIHESGIVDDMFIFPAANDGGTAIGAAMIAAVDAGDKVKFKMEHAYYGPHFSDAEISKILDDRKIKYREEKGVAKFAAEAIAGGKIIGWFQGSMELGPRALGNRSILADPTNPDIKDIVNTRVKHREPWRPFCPSLLAGAMDEYFENAYDSPFMIMAFKAKPGKEKEVPSVVHVDGTVRPQAVKKEVNPLYYDLISHFERVNGAPIVLNTSFNLRGEPIVCKPEDAIRTFYNSGMDYLIMGNCVVEKKCD